jgi:benzaldehyde dehydrogenase (NAD)
MTLMDEPVWRGKIFSGGWMDGTGGDAPVIEPATGREIGRAGRATPVDVARAAQIAAAAQPAWAATPHPERSAILRRAADIWLANAVSAGAWGSFLHQGQICMTTGRHLVHEAIYDEYVARLAQKASHLPVGDPASGQVALGPVIDERQRDKIHGLVTGSVAAGARLAAGGSYEGLFYSPTVLAEVSAQMPAYAQEVFGPVAPVLRFSSEQDAAKLAAQSEYGLSLGVLTRDVMRGLDLARQIPTGIVHINEQTVDDEPNIPFGGLGASGTGARFGGTANLEAFTDTRWVTIRGDIAPYPF